MKKILILVLIVFFNLSTKAQSPIYDTCQYLSQYQGTNWYYINGQDTIKLHFRYHLFFSRHENGGSSVRDNLLGWIEYKSGTTVLESDYMYRYQPLPFDYDAENPPMNFSIWLHLPPECEASALKLKGFMWDAQTRKKYFDVDILLNSTKTQMTFKTNYPEGYNTIAGTDYNRFLPAEITLIKQ